MDLYYPAYYQLYQRQKRNWHVHYATESFQVPTVKELVSGNNLVQLLSAVNRNKGQKKELTHRKLESFGLTHRKVVLEFKLLTGGKEGYYLANLRDKAFHYCGINRESVRLKLMELGMGFEC